MLKAQTISLSFVIILSSIRVMNLDWSPNHSERENILEFLSIANVRKLKHEKLYCL